MLEGDTEVTARQSAPIVEDPRFRHFHDPEKRSGTAIAESMGGQDRVAWDIYLFFAKGSEWQEDPPSPTDWMHQLSASWADPTHFHYGDGLVAELHKTMTRLADKRA